MGDLGATSLLYSARPALTLDGAREASLEQGLLSLAVEETVEGLASCEACFGNWGTLKGEIGFLYFDRQVLEFGRALAVQMGSGEAAGEIFAGRISALEGRFPKSRPPEMLVLAEDRLQDLRMTRRSRTFEDTDLDDGDPRHRLRPRPHARARPRQPDSTRCSPSSTRAISRSSASARATSTPRSGARRPAVRPGPQPARRRGDPADLRPGAARARGHRRPRRPMLEAHRRGLGGRRQGRARPPRPAPASLAAESQGDSGSAVLDQALGERTEQLVHELPLTGAEADALAAAHYRRRARRFLRGEAIAEGNGRLRAGTQVALRGCGPLFDGAYTVVSVRHSFDLEEGFRSRIRARAAMARAAVMLAGAFLDPLVDDRLPLGAGGRFYGVWPALVTDLADPDAQGRVRVRLPWSPDGGGATFEAWARVATLFAGGGRGSWFIPDTGDEVLIAFAGGDPRHPFVLGGLVERPRRAARGDGRRRREQPQDAALAQWRRGPDGRQPGLGIAAARDSGRPVGDAQGRPGAIEIVDANGNSVKLEAAGITVESSAKVTVNASTVEVSASLVTVNAGMSRFSGTVQADTVISNSVISASYTPGAGNIW